MPQIDGLKYHAYHRFKKIMWDKRTEMRDKGFRVEDISILIDGFADALLENVNLNMFVEKNRERGWYAYQKTA